MKCIYTVFYKKLKNYDGNDTNSELRLKLLEYCLKSYRMCNPNTDVIIEYVEEEVDNTSMMYFDKMRRIKDLNRSHDVLWVDCDTICLENLDHMMDDKMHGVFWGWWDGLNYLNGGVIYYPRNFLYNNWDFFVSDWIRLLSLQNKTNEKFIGPHEQEPITNLFLKQISTDYDNKKFSFFDNWQDLVGKNYLLDWRYNYNPIVNNKMENTHRYNLSCNNILNKKILHLNATNVGNGVIDYFHFFKYIVENLVGYTSDLNKLIKRCDEFYCSNKFIDYKLNDRGFDLTNKSLSVIKVFVFYNKDFMLGNSVNYFVNPGHFLHINYDQIKFANLIVVKNMFSGEDVILNVNE